MKHFTHQSETVTRFFSAIQKFYPDAKITEIKELEDYGNEYAFVINIYFEESESYDGVAHNLESKLNTIADSLSQESDFSISQKTDYTNNHLLSLITFAK